MPAKHGVAHAVEEAALLLLRRVAAPGLRLQLFDAGVGAFKRLVHDQGRLHQRVGGVRCPSQAIRDHALGSWVAGAIFQFGQTIEQLVDQFLLLRCNAALPGVRIRHLCGVTGWGDGRGHGSDCSCRPGTAPITDPAAESIIRDLRRSLKQHTVAA